jgi:subtilisin family serine protease
MLARLDGDISVDEAVRRAQADPRVEYAEPNYLYKTSATSPNDPLFPEQWGLKSSCLLCPPVAFPWAEGGEINLQRAWDLTTGNDDIVVAVIDTGIDLSHPDLAPNAWVNPAELAGNGQDDDGNGYVDDINGWNFANDDNLVYRDADADLHGTHVAGTIGAIGNNEIGVAGVAWQVKLMSLKFIGKKGTGPTSSAIKAIEYAIDQKKRGINVRAINASWGGAGDSRALREAIIRAGEAGILFVCSAGNEEADVDYVPSYPVAYSKDVSTLISAAATTPGGQLAYFSNYGHRTVSVGAPGWQILSTQAGGGYLNLTGTSMAAPHVTGVAALLSAKEPSLTPAEIKHRILATAFPRTAFASRSVSAGQVSAYNALTNHIPSVGPYISAVKVTNKKIILDGVGFVNGSSIIEVYRIAPGGVNRVPLPTQYDESYLVPSGAVTRLIANLGKKAMKSSVPKLEYVYIQVHNPATGEWSPPWETIRH